MRSEDDRVIDVSKLKVAVKSLPQQPKDESDYDAIEEQMFGQFAAQVLTETKPAEESPAEEPKKEEKKK